MNQGVRFAPQFIKHAIVRELQTRRAVTHGLYNRQERSTSYYNYTVVLVKYLLHPANGTVTISIEGLLLLQFIIFPNYLTEKNGKSEAEKSAVTCIAQSK